MRTWCVGHNLEERCENMLHMRFARRGGLARGDMEKEKKFMMRGMGVCAAV